MTNKKMKSNKGGRKVTFQAYSVDRDKLRDYAEDVHMLETDTE